MFSTVNLKLYPNPSFDHKAFIDFDLDFSSEIEIDLLGLNGNIIQSLFKGNGNQGENKISLELSDELVNGVYFIRVKTDRGIFMKKLEVFRH